MYCNSLVAWCSFRSPTKPWILYNQLAWYSLLCLGARPLRQKQQCPNLKHYLPHPAFLDMLNNLVATKIRNLHNSMYIWPLAQHIFLHKLGMDTQRLILAIMGDTKLISVGLNRLAITCMGIPVTAAWSISVWLVKVFRMHQVWTRH